MLNLAIAPFLLADRLFIKYAHKDFPPKEHKGEIMKKFIYEFMSINGVRLTTKKADP